MSKVKKVDDIGNEESDLDLKKLREMRDDPNVPIEEMLAEAMKMALPGSSEKAQMAMVMTQEMGKYHDKVNAMIEVALDGKLYPAIYVQLMKEMSDAWLKEMKRRIVESGDKEELETYNGAIDLIKDAMESGAFKMVTRENKK